MGKRRGHENDPVKCDGCSLSGGSVTDHCL